MTILPKMILTTAEIAINDIQARDSEVPSRNARATYLENRHVMIKKSNALLRTARGVVCNINVKVVQIRSRSGYD